MFTRRTALAGMSASMLTASAAAKLLPATPRETEGPFYPVELPRDMDADLTRVAGRAGRAVGEVIEIHGRVLRRNGELASGTQIELWQANAAGRYFHPLDQSALPIDPDFQGFARIRAGADGRFRLVTIKPGSYSIPDGPRRTPHIHFQFGNRTGDRLVTQMYFPGEPLNEADILIKPMATRGVDPGLLVARTAPSGAEGLPRFLWDIVLDG